MPGTPIIYYGDEIGMGDNLHLGDRNGVARRCNGRRTAMAVFPGLTRPRLRFTAIMDPLYGYGA